MAVGSNDGSRTVWRLHNFRCFTRTHDCLYVPFLKTHSIQNHCEAATAALPMKSNRFFFPSCQSKQRLDGEFNQVLLAPLDSCPYSFIRKHQGSLENRVGTSNFGCNAEVLGNKTSYRQSVANGKETPEKSLGKRPSCIVGTRLSSRLRLVHDTFSNKHGEGLAKEIRSDNGKGCRDGPRETEGRHESH